MPTPTNGPGADTTPPTPTGPADPLLTIVEAAAYLSVSRSYIQRLIYNTRTLPALRIAGPGRGVVRVRRSALDALLAPVVP